MARSGDVITNPLQGQRIHFRRTSVETGGDYVEFDSYVAPGGFVPIAHRHWRQDEHFSVVSGTIAVRIGNDLPRLVQSGAELRLPPNTPHIWWNPGEDEAHAIVTLRPALEFDVFLETLFGLAHDGKTDRKGNPSLLQAALLADQYRCYLAALPVWTQRPIVGIAALIGRKAGYRARYPRYSAILAA